MAIASPAPVVTTDKKQPSPAAEAFRKGADPKNEMGFRKEAPAEASPVKPNVPPDPAATAMVPEVKTETVSPPDPAKPAQAAPNPNEGFIPKPIDPETNLTGLRKAREAAEARAAAAEARAKELEAKVPVEDYRAKYEEALTLLEKVQVQESPRFKEKYEKPTQELLSGMEKALKGAGKDAGAFVNLLNSPESVERNTQLEEMINGLDRFTQDKIARGVTEFDRLRDQRNAELTKPGEAFSKIRQEQEQVAQQQREAQTAVLRDTIARAEQNIPWFKEIEGNEGWNAQIRAVKERAARSWTGGNDIKDMAELTFAGAIAPMLKTGLDTAHAEIERLNAIVAEYEQADPKTRAGASAGAAAAVDPSGKGAANDAFFAASGMKRRSR